MREKIERNSARMGGFNAFRQGLIEQRNMARRQMVDKMRKLYALDKQIQYLNKFKPWGDDGDN